MLWRQARQERKAGLLLLVYIACLIREAASVGGLFHFKPNSRCRLLALSGQSWVLAGDELSANDPGRVKTRSVLFVGGVSGDPGGIVRLGAANSAELDRADA